MKRNDIKQLQELDLAGLNKKLIELSTAVAKARLEKKAGKLANLRQVSQLADDIARVKTILSQKEMEATV
jgi:ribosomal protein L29